MNQPYSHRTILSNLAGIVVYWVTLVDTANYWINALQIMQSIEPATKSLQNMESRQHTMVHNESTTIRPLNIHKIGVLKQDPEQQPA